MTLIGAGNAVGTPLPAYCIFKQWPDISWGDRAFGLDEDIRFARSDTAFNNGEITLDWIKHFNIHAWKAHREVQTRGLEPFDFKAWFGCDQNCEDPESNIGFIDTETVPVEWALRRRTPEKERIYRLLILDSFSGHHSLELYEYYMQFDIILLFLPPHLSLISNFKTGRLGLNKVI